MTVTAIVLAAGQGSRFRAETGQDKLLAQCVGLDGVTRPMIEQVLLSLPQCVEARVLVTSPDRLEVIRLAEAYSCKVLLLESAGMGDSIAAAVASSRSAEGWLVVLGDMPFIQPPSVERVIDAVVADGISVPFHNGQYGHPVAFGRELGPALMALTGDRGAKPLFTQAPVSQVSVADPGVLWDVDLPRSLSFTPI